MSKRTTKTVRLQSTPPAMVVEINRQESQGWSVYLIKSTVNGFIVVFERE